jgi:uncharacterized iron-regulated membrane protein
MKLRSFHIKLGLLLTLPLLIIVVTGMILGFHDSIQSSQFPYLLDHPVTRSPQSYDVALRQAQALYPNSRIDALHLPSDPSQSLRIKMVHPADQKALVIFVNPETGEILAQKDGVQLDALEWIYRLHRGTWAGSVGRALGSSLGILIFLLWPTGWLLRRRRIRFQKRPLKKSRLSKASPLLLHRLLGYAFGGGIAFMALSGAMMNYNSDLLKWLDPPPSSGQKQVDPQSSIQDLATKIQLASSARPHSQLRSIYFPKANDRHIFFYYKDNSRVYIDAESNKILKVMSPTSHWLHALYPIHSGRVLGKGAPVFIISMGLSTLLISALGIYLARKSVLNPVKALFK